MAWPALWAAVGLAVISFDVNPIVALIAAAVAVSGRWSCIPPFWALPTAFLSGTAAAGGIALINAVGNLGGFVGPFLMGWLSDLTGSVRGRVARARGRLRSRRADRSRPHVRPCKAHG